MEMMRRREFREDLFYRINVGRLKIPPLRERREDIPILIDHFIGKINLRQSEQVKKVSPSGLRILLNHGFPGNVRELENVIEHTMILTKGIEIQPRHLPSYLVGGGVWSRSFPRSRDMAWPFLMRWSGI